MSLLLLAITTTVALFQVGSLQNVHLAITGSLYRKEWGRANKETYHEYLKHIATRTDTLRPGKVWVEAVKKPGIPVHIQGDAKSKYQIDNEPLSWWLSYDIGKQGEPHSRVYTLVHGGGNNLRDCKAVFSARFASESVTNNQLDISGFKAELKAAFEALELEEGIFEPEL